MINKSKIGIIGLGFVGGAMFKSFQQKGLILNDNLFVYDKYKNGGIGSFEGILSSNIIFLCLPTLFNSTDCSYDKTPIYETCYNLQNNNFNGAVVVKSTVEPNTCNDLSNIYKLNIVNNPEFLTARTAFHDFHNQKHIVLGKSNLCSKQKFESVIDFYKIYYPSADISTSTSTESELMKISVNCFYATKIQFMNEIYLLSKSTNSNYNKIRELMLKNGWINPMHTIVPGTDGKLSYGGLCFPKDTNALLHFMKKNNTNHLVLEAVVKERNIMRKD